MPEEEHKKLAKTLLALPGAVNASLEFRAQIFSAYGFTDSARELIEKNSRIIVLDFTGDSGGGYWWPPGASPFSNLVELFSIQHEAAVHELAHAFWEYFRKDKFRIRYGLARKLVSLADMDPESYPEFEEAIKLARGYVYGIGEWIGMYGNADYKNNPRNLPKDLHNLTEEDLGRRVNDWEIFAGLASFTMGRFMDGPRKLPPFMWQYLEAIFTGSPNAVPYYMREHP